VGDGRVSSTQLRAGTSGGGRARTRTADMPSRGGQRKRKASERAAAAAAAAQEAQEAAVAAAAARGRGKENAKAKRARQQAEKVLRAHGVEPVAAADDPTGYAHVQQLAELNLKLQKAQNRGPEAAVRYRSTTPSPMKRKVRRRAVATVGADEDEAGDDESGEGEDSDAVEDDDEEAESESEPESYAESDEGESADEEEKKRNAELIEERMKMSRKKARKDAATRAAGREFHREFMARPEVRKAKAEEEEADEAAETKAAKVDKRKAAVAAGGGGSRKKKKKKKGPAVTGGSAKAAATWAAVSMAAMTVSQIFAHAKEQGVPDDKLLKVLDAADQKAAIIRLVERMATAGADELDGMDFPDLMKEAVGMGMDIDDALACLDGAVSDEVAEEKLRAMIRKGPDDDGMGGLSFVELSKRAEVAGIGQAQVIKCIRDGGEAKGQKALLRGLISAAEKKLSEAPGKAGAEDVSSDKPKGAGSKADADGDDEDQERLMGALVGAATAKDLGKAGQHFRSAALQRVKMRQAGGPTEVNTDGPAGRMTKSGQEKLKKALAKGDKKYIDDVMYNLDLEMHQGESPAMTEMAKAAKQAGPQGASARFIPWSKRPQVSPPAAEFSGMRPTIKADQVDTPNILFPRWFLRDPNKLLSDSWKPKAKLGDYSWTGDDKKDDVKLLGFTTPDDC
jgi:hypothetical protein